MSMSDCPHCWDTPCTCGHEYRNWDTERIIKQINMLIKVLATRGITKISHLLSIIE